MFSLCLSVCLFVCLCFSTAGLCKTAQALLLTLSGWMPNEKQRSEETQALRAGSSKAEPKIFAPPQTRFPGARDGQNLISWRWSLPLPTNPVWWRSMHAISGYRGNRPTHTHKHTHRQDRLQYTVPQLASAQCKYNTTVNNNLVDCDAL